VSAFDDDFAAVDGMFAEAFGVDVTYMVESVEHSWTAEVVLQQHETTDERGAKTTVTSRDYIGSAAELGVTPEAGHRIIETIEGVARTFEVMPVAGAPCWEPAGESGRQILVRTKEIE
jgi:hypothetical protein